jgi:methyltransferase (TIGR00027 family)
MKDDIPSTTALATARMRSIHTSHDPEPIIRDPWGSKLAPTSALAFYMSGGESASTDETMTEDAIDALLRASSAYANVIARACYTETALGSAISSGVTQYVQIGAGFDSYALRRPKDALELEIFEIDHPATQAFKKQRLAECGAPHDDRLHFVSADLGQETVESALRMSSYNSSEPAFLSWLGVTMYLPREANMATLKSVARYCAPGSLLVFTYIDQIMFDGLSSAEAQAFAALKLQVKTAGEPFVSGFHPDALEQDLREIGLELEEDLDDTQILDRFDPTGANGLVSTATSHIARVRVLGNVE